MKPRGFSHCPSVRGYAMRYEVKMRDGSTYQVDASFIEVSDGPAESSYTLLGQVPGYPIAILAAFPVDMVETIMPAHERPRAPAAAAAGGSDADDVDGADAYMDDIY